MDTINKQNLLFLESTIKMPLMSLPVRSVLARLDQGSVLISPGSRLTDEQLRSVGPVTDLVGPSLFHRGGLTKARQIFPKARVWAENLSADSWPYQQELPMILLAGMPKVNEAVFVHKKSKSLIVADLCFNMTHAQGLGAWLILNMFGTYRKMGVSRFFSKFVTDKTAFEKSLGEVFAYDFENIILSHGDNIMGNGRAELLRALRERGFTPQNAKS